MISLRIVAYFPLPRPLIAELETEVAADDRRAERLDVEYIRFCRSLLATDRQAMARIQARLPSADFRSLFAALLEGGAGSSIYHLVGRKSPDDKPMVVDVELAWTTLAIVVDGTLEAFGLLERVALLNFGPLPRHISLVGRHEALEAMLAGHWLDGVVERDE